MSKQTAHVSPREIRSSGFASKSLSVWHLFVHNPKPWSVMSTFSALVSSFFSVFSDGVNLFFFVTAGSAVIFFVFSIYLSIVNQREINGRGKTIVESVDLKRVLRAIALNGGFIDLRHPWRITLYRSDEDDTWTKISRVSSSGVFESTDEYSVLKSGQGVLRGMSWTAGNPDGSSQETAFFVDPIRDRTQWTRMMKDWGLQDQSLYIAGDSSHGMPTQKFCCRVFRVGAADKDHGDMTLGIVVEGMGSDHCVNFIAMQQALSRPVFEMLYEIIAIRKNVTDGLGQFTELI